MQREWLPTRGQGFLRVGRRGAEPGEGARCVSEAGGGAG